MFRTPMGVVRVRVAAHPNYTITIIYIYIYIYFFDESKIWIDARTTVVTGNYSITADGGGIQCSSSLYLAFFVILFIFDLARYIRRWW